MEQYRESRKRRFRQVREQSKEIAGIIQDNAHKEREKQSAIMKEIKKSETDAEVNASSKVLQNYFENCLNLVGQGFRDAEYETSLQINKDIKNKLKELNYKKIAIIRGKEALLNKQKEQEERMRKKFAITHLRQAVLKKEKKRAAKIAHNYYHHPDIVERIFDKQKSSNPKSVLIHDQSKFPVTSVKESMVVVEKNNEKMNNTEITLIEISKEEKDEEIKKKMKDQRILKSKERYKSAKNEQLSSKEYSNILEKLEQMKIAERKKKSKEVGKGKKNILLHEFRMELFKDRQFREIKSEEVISKERINAKAKDIIDDDLNKEFEKNFPSSVFDTENTTARIFYTDPLRFTRNYSNEEKHQIGLETMKNIPQREVPEWKTVENSYEKEFLETGQKIENLIENIRIVRAEISRNKKPRFSKSSDNKKENPERMSNKDKIERTKYLYKYPKKSVRTTTSKTENISTPIKEKKITHISKYCNFGTQTNAESTEDKKDFTDNSYKSDSLYPLFSSSTSYYSLPKHHGQPNFTVQNESSSSFLTESKTEYEDLLHRYKKLKSYETPPDIQIEEQKIASKQNHVTNLSINSEAENQLTEFSNVHINQKNELQKMKTNRLHPNDDKSEYKKLLKKHVKSIHQNCSNENIVIKESQIDRKLLKTNSQNYNQKFINTLTENIQTTWSSKNILIEQGNNTFIKKFCLKTHSKNKKLCDYSKRNKVQLEFELLTKVKKYKKFLKKYKPNNKKLLNENMKLEKRELISNTLLDYFQCESNISKLPQHVQIEMNNSLKQIISKEKFQYEHDKKNNSVNISQIGQKNNDSYMYENTLQKYNKIIFLDDNNNNKNKNESIICNLSIKNSQSEKITSHILTSLVQSQKEINYDLTKKDSLDDKKKINNKKNINLESDLRETNFPFNLDEKIDFIKQCDVTETLISAKQARGNVEILNDDIKYKTLFNSIFNKEKNSIEKYQIQSKIPLVNFYKMNSRAALQINNFLKESKVSKQLEDFSKIKQSCMPKQRVLIENKSIHDMKKSLQIGQLKMQEFKNEIFLQERDILGRNRMRRKIIPSKINFALQTKKSYSSVESVSINQSQEHCFQKVIVNQKVIHFPRKSIQLKELNYPAYLFKKIVQQEQIDFLKKKEHISKQKKIFSKERIKGAKLNHSRLFHLNAKQSLSFLSELQIVTERLKQKDQKNSYFLNDLSEDKSLILYNSLPISQNIKTGIPKIILHNKTEDLLKETAFFKPRLSINETDNVYHNIKNLNISEDEPQQNLSLLKMESSVNLKNSEIVKQISFHQPNYVLCKNIYPLSSKNFKTKSKYGQLPICIIMNYSNRIPNPFELDESLEISKPDDVEIKRNENFIYTKDFPYKNMNRKIKKNKFKKIYRKIKRKKFTLAKNEKIIFDFNNKSRKKIIDEETESISLKSSVKYDINNEKINGTDLFKQWENIENSQPINIVSYISEDTLETSPECQDNIDSNSINQLSTINQIPSPKEYFHSETGTSKIMQFGLFKKQNSGECIDSVLRNLNQIEQISHTGSEKCTSQISKEAFNSTYSPSHIHHKTSGLQVLQVEREHPFSAERYSPSSIQHEASRRQGSQSERDYSLVDSKNLPMENQHNDISQSGREQSQIERHHPRNLPAQIQHETSRMQVSHIRNNCSSVNSRNLPVHSQYDDYNLSQKGEQSQMGRHYSSLTPRNLSNQNQYDSSQTVREQQPRFDYRTNNIRFTANPQSFKEEKLSHLNTRKQSQNHHVPELQTKLKPGQIVNVPLNNNTEYSSPVNCIELSSYLTTVLKLPFYTFDLQNTVVSPPSNDQTYRPHVSKENNQYPNDSTFQNIDRSQISEYRPHSFRISYSPGRSFENIQGDRFDIENKDFIPETIKPPDEFADTKQDIQYSQNLETGNVFPNNLQSQSKFHVKRPSGSIINEIGGISCGDYQQNDLSTSQLNANVISPFTVEDINRVHPAVAIDEPCLQFDRETVVTVPKLSEPTVQISKESAVDDKSQIQLEDDATINIPEEQKIEGKTKIDITENINQTKTESKESTIIENIYISTSKHVRFPDSEADVIQVSQISNNEELPPVPYHILKLLFHEDFQAVQNKFIEMLNEREGRKILSSISDINTLKQILQQGVTKDTVIKDPKILISQDFQNKNKFFDREDISQAGTEEVRVTDTVTDHSGHQQQKTSISKIQDEEHGSYKKIMIPDEEVKILDEVFDKPEQYQTSCSEIQNTDIHTYKREGIISAEEIIITDTIVDKPRQQQQNISIFKTHDKNFDTYDGEQMISATVNQVDKVLTEQKTNQLNASFQDFMSSETEEAKKAIPKLIKENIPDTIISQLNETEKINKSLQEWHEGNEFEKIEQNFTTQQQQDITIENQTAVSNSQYRLESVIDLDFSEYYINESKIPFQLRDSDIVYNRYKDIDIGSFPKEIQFKEVNSNLKKTEFYTRESLNPFENMEFKNLEDIDLGTFPKPQPFGKNEQNSRKADSFSDVEKKDISLGTFPKSHHSGKDVAYEVTRNSIYHPKIDRQHEQKVIQWLLSNSFSINHYQQKNETIENTKHESIKERLDNSEMNKNYELKVISWLLTNIFNNDPSQKQNETSVDIDSITSSQQLSHFKNYIKNVLLQNANSSFSDMNVQRLELNEDQLNILAVMLTQIIVLNPDKLENTEEIQTYMNNFENIYSIIKKFLNKMFKTTTDIENGESLFLDESLINCLTALLSEFLADENVKNSGEQKYNIQQQAEKLEEESNIQREILSPIHQSQSLSSFLNQESGEKTIMRLLAIARRIIQNNSMYKQNIQNKHELSKNINQVVSNSEQQQEKINSHSDKSLSLPENERFFQKFADFVIKLFDSSDTNLDSSDKTMTELFVNVCKTFLLELKAKLLEKQKTETIVSEMKSKKQQHCRFFKKNESDSFITGYVNEEGFKLNNKPGQKIMDFSEYESSKISNEQIFPNQYIIKSSLKKEPATIINHKDNRDESHSNNITDFHHCNKVPIEQFLKSEKDEFYLKNQRFYFSENEQSGIDEQTLSDSNEVHDQQKLQTTFDKIPSTRNKITTQKIDFKYPSRFTSFLGNDLIEKIKEKKRENNVITYNHEDKNISRQNDNVQFPFDSRRATDYLDKTSEHTNSDNMGKLNQVQSDIAINISQEILKSSEKFKRETVIPTEYNASDKREFVISGSISARNTPRQTFISFGTIKNQNSKSENMIETDVEKISKEK